MIGISYTPSFIKQYNSLEKDLQDEVVDKIELFKKIKNHKQLKVHKLKGKLNGRYSFSVNYNTRIVFNYVSKKEAVFLVIGDHDIYKK